MPENGPMRPKHVAEEYKQDEYKNKNVAFRMVITLIHRRLALVSLKGEDRLGQS
jgi:hypothetical protein